MISVYRSSETREKRKLRAARVSFEPRAGRVSPRQKNPGFLLKKPGFNPGAFVRSPVLLFAWRCLACRAQRGPLVTGLRGSSLRFPPQQSLGSPGNPPWAFCRRQNAPDGRFQRLLLNHSPARSHVTLLFCPSLQNHNPKTLTLTQKP